VCFHLVSRWGEAGSSLCVCVCLCVVRMHVSVGRENEFGSEKVEGGDVGWSTGVCAWTSLDILEL